MRAFSAAVLGAALLLGAPAGAHVPDRCLTQIIDLQTVRDRTDKALGGKDKSKLRKAVRAERRSMGKLLNCAHHPEGRKKGP